MEDLLPDIESFKPWNLEDDMLDRLISDQHRELKHIYETERSYKIGLAIALKNLIDQQKMNTYLKSILRVKK
jgi:hypothetical protein